MSFSPGDRIRFTCDATVSVRGDKGNYIVVFDSDGSRAFDGDFLVAHATKIVPTWATGDRGSMGGLDFEVLSVEDQTARIAFPQFGSFRVFLDDLAASGAVKLPSPRIAYSGMRVRDPYGNSLVLVGMGEKVHAIHQTHRPLTSIVFGQPLPDDWEVEE